MASEITALLKVTTAATALTAYARFISSKTSPGRGRLLALLPPILLLPLLPLLFSSLHLRGISAFFLAWLAVFKLLLLAFAAGPLLPSLPLPAFLPTALLPVNPAPRPKPPHLVPTALKALLLSLLLPLYTRHDKFHHLFLLAIYCIHIYLALELVLAAAAFLAGTLLGLNLDPQFDAPYLSTSLQDFWGRRWNLMVTGILRPSVYAPVRARWGTVAGMLATFLVSGLMHELMFWYITRAAPTGEVLGFFALHGVCVVAEVWGKRRLGAGWRVGRGVSIVGTVGFVAATGFWLFFPQIVRNGTDRRAVEESMEVMRFLGGGGRLVLGMLGLGMNGTEAKV